MKKVFAIALALLLACASVTAMAETLTMATNAAFPPYEFIGDDGKPTGIDVEIADAIAKKLGYDGVEVLDMEFDSVVTAVSSGSAMVAMAGLTATPERMNNVYFTFPYAKGIQSIIVKEGSPIASVDDLFVEGNNYTVGVQLSTTGDIYSTGDLEDAGLATISRFSTGNDAVMALISGKVDCVIIDNEPAKAYVAANEGLTILDTNYAEEDYAIGISKDNVELLGKVNAALQDLIADGTVDSIISKYINAGE